MRYLYLAALPVLLVACSEQAPMEPFEESPAVAAFDFMNNPDIGNLKVYRYEDHIRTCWTDPDNGLRACHQTFPFADPDCGIQAAEAPLGYQTVVIDADNIRAITNAVGDAYVFVRDTNAPGTCFDNALVAQGWGSLRYTDNDTWGTGYYNANHWGFTADGDLMTPGGDPLKYTGHAVLLWNSPQQFRFISAQVTLQ